MFQPSNVLSTDYTTFRLQRSFPVSIVWISIGAIFATNKQNAKERRKYVFLLVLIGISLLFAEYYLIQNMGLGNPKENDCYFLLLLVSVK